MTSNNAVVKARNRGRKQLTALLSRFSLTVRQVQGMFDLLEEMGANDPWSIVLFFVSPNIILGNRVPIDVLVSRKKTDWEDLRRAARSWRYQGAI